MYIHIARLCFLVSLLTALQFSGYSQTQAPKESSPSMTLQSSHAPVAGPDSGTAIEILAAGGYTYVLLDTGKGKIWAAGPPTSVRPGDRIRLQNPMPMHNFESKSLKRTFETIYFASSLSTSSGEPPVGPKSAAIMPPGHTTVAQQPVVGVNPLAGGYSIGEIFSKKAELGGKKVRFRAQVVKISRGILGKNWIHLQDGTGGEKQNDLTINTKADADKGDILIVSGILTANKDFGMGYLYELIIEDAEIKVEKSSKP